mgnify:CR=1 FL=1
MAIAFMLNEKVVGWKFFRSIYFLPTAISWVVIGMVAMRFFAAEGGLNQLLKTFGLGFIQTDFLSSEQGALFAVGAVFVWSMIGTNSIIFLTGMATLDQSLNEAAHMDGAATIPRARGRGAQNALLAVRLAYARERGCDIAVVGTACGSASPRNAERNGFRIAYTRTKWTRA